MAKLYISEYNKLGSGYDNIVVAEPASVEQTPVAIGGTTTQSQAFAANTRIIRVHTDVICSVAVGVNPAATTNSKRMIAGQTEYFAVTPGHKIAVISNT